MGHGINISQRTPRTLLRLHPGIRFATASAFGGPEPIRGIITSRSLRDRVRLWRTGNNGDNRIRTGDPLLAKQVLYQLSYVPLDQIPSGNDDHWWAREDLNLRPHAYQACALTN